MALDWDGLEAIGDRVYDSLNGNDLGTACEIVAREDVDSDAIVNFIARVTRDGMRAEAAAIASAALFAFMLGREVEAALQFEREFSFDAE